MNEQLPDHRALSQGFRPGWNPYNCTVNDWHRVSGALAFEAYCSAEAGPHTRTPSRPGWPHVFTDQAQPGCDCLPCVLQRGFRCRAWSQQRPQSAGLNGWSRTGWPIP